MGSNTRGGLLLLRDREDSEGRMGRRKIPEGCSAPDTARLCQGGFAFFYKKGLAGLLQRQMLLQIKLSEVPAKLSVKFLSSGSAYTFPPCPKKMAVPLALNVFILRAGERTEDSR